MQPCGRPLHACGCLSGCGSRRTAGTVVSVQAEWRSGGGCAGRSAVTMQLESDVSEYLYPQPFLQKAQTSYF